MSWFLNLKNWVLSWLTDQNKMKLLQFLTGMQVFIDWAYPIVKKIDEELKPLLRLENMPVVEALTKFLEEYEDEFDDVVELVQSLKDLPLADLLMNVALELLKVRANTGNVAVSVLRLAVELAYNVYKVDVNKANMPSHV